MVWATRSMVKAGEMTAVKIDFSNAFNMVSRQVMVNLVAEAVPEMLPWVWFCYGKPSWLQCTDGTMILSTSGVQQGDPLGPALFCMVLNSCLMEVRPYSHSLL